MKLSQCTDEELLAELKRRLDQPCEPHIIKVGDRYVGGNGLRLVKTKAEAHVYSSKEKADDSASTFPIVDLDETYGVTVVPFN